MKLDSFAKRFRIDRPDKFRLAACDPADRCGLSIEKKQAKAMLAKGIDLLSDLQERLYAHDRWSVLIVLQAMDAAGKDSLIEHVMSGVNPQGVEVTPFKQPSAEELDHDFLWRIVRHLPARGRIGIFNRSHYEEVLTVRVHSELLERQKLPAPCIGKDMWRKRFEDIRAFERHLANNGTRVIKFFLNVSKEEQRKRFLDRIEEPAKRWKFSMGDVTERKLWDEYMAAYEDMIRQTSRPEAPWYVLPADHKWVTRMAASAVIVHELQALKLEFPKIGRDALKELHGARTALLAEESRR